MWIADAHLDLAYELQKRHIGEEGSIIAREYLPLWKKSAVGLIVSSLYLDSRDLPENGLRQCLLQVEALRSEIKNTEGLCLIRNRQDLYDCRENGKLGVLMSFEGVDPLGEDDRLLELFQELGVRGVGLVWSRRNAAGEGSPLNKKAAESKNGLGAMAHRLFSHAGGLYIDLAHLNKAGFWEALEAWPGPLMVSHSNAAAVHDSPRNLEDRQIQAVFRRGGFIGVNAMNFTVSDGSRDSLDGYIDHLLYFLELGGEDQLGFGFDFNEQLLPFVPQAQLALLPRPPKDCVQGYADLPALLQRMRERGITEKQCRKIAGENLFRFLAAALPE